MRTRFTFGMAVVVMVLVGGWFFWPSGLRQAAPKQVIARPDFASVRSGSTAPLLFTAGKTAVSTNASASKTNKFAYRLSNTPKLIGELMNNPHAILLENALIDSS